MKEITINQMDYEFDRMFDDIDVGSNYKTERNSVSFRSIMEAYEESKQ